MQLVLSDPVFLHEHQPQNIQSTWDRKEVDKSIKIALSKNNKKECYFKIKGTEC